MIKMEILVFQLEEKVLIDKKILENLKSVFENLKKDKPLFLIQKILKMFIYLQLWVFR